METVSIDSVSTLLSLIGWGEEENFEGRWMEGAVELYFHKGLLLVPLIIHKETCLTLYFGDIKSANGDN